MTQVIILNSGSGSRMGELTKDLPKCLVELKNGETILSRQISFLTALGIEDIIITTGPFEEKVRSHLEERFPAVRVRYVHNRRYRETNYIYSLLLAGDMIREELLLMHGDMVFVPEALERLMAAEVGNRVLVNPHVPLPEKDFKAELKEGRIRRIGVDTFGPDCVFLLPIYRLTKDAFAKWYGEMKIFEAEKNLQVYAENALNNLLSELVLKPVALDGEFCMEIDDRADLKKARRYLASLGGKTDGSL